MSIREEKYKRFVEEDIKDNRGRLVQSCEELKYLLDNPKVNEIFVKHNLNDILTYATTFSEYYYKYKNFTCLQDFPIVNKQILKDNWDKIMVTNYKDAEGLKEKFTSGSTGTPFKMVMDKYKHCRWIAGNKVFRDNVGVPSHTKTVFISETVLDKNIPMERQEKDNVYYLDCRYFDDDSFANILKYIVTNEVETLTALASLLERLSRFIREGKANEYRRKLKAVFSVSETLKESTRKTISEFFECPVYVLYANEENGVLAVEDGSDNGCRANTVDFILEVLALDSDEPVEDGEVGRLVITDLYNKAFPVIRYENGDLVSKKTLSDGRVYITEIVGRKTDVLYTTDGRIVHYFSSISFLESYMDIKQFQLIQEDYHNFTWILNTNNHSYEDEIVKECKKLFGEDSNWKFQYVNEIPKLKSGKARMTVCNIKEKIS